MGIHEVLEWMSNARRCLALVEPAANGGVRSRRIDQDEPPFSGPGIAHSIKVLRDLHATRMQLALASSSQPNPDQSTKPARVRLGFTYSFGGY